MFLPCIYNTKDREKGWVNVDYIVDVLLVGDSVIAYTMDEEHCSYIIRLDMWQAYLMSLVEVDEND